MIYTTRVVALESCHRRRARVSCAKLFVREELNVEFALIFNPAVRAAPAAGLRHQVFSSSKAHLYTSWSLP